MQQEPKAEEERPDLEHGKMPDPEAKAISCLFDQIRALEKKIEGLTDRLEKAESKPSAKRSTTVKTTTVKPKSKTADSTRKKEKAEA